MHIRCRVLGMPCSYSESGVRTSIFRSCFGFLVPAGTAFARRPHCASRARPGPRSRTMVLEKLNSTVANGTCDGKELCALAKKVPKVLKGGAQNPGGAVDQDKLNRDQLVAIVDKLWKRQNYIRDVFSDSSARTTRWVMTRATWSSRNNGRRTV